MFLTADQAYILSILQKTRFMRKDQALRLLGKLDGRKTESQLACCLRQLRYIARIAWNTEAVFTLPDLYNSEIDEDMLSAVDIMLDLADGQILALSAPGPPFKLRFMTEQEQSLKAYAIAAVPPGYEAVSAAILNESALPKGSTLMLLLSELSQTEKIRIVFPHYFVIRGEAGYRYFEGRSGARP
jgi:hypothetical protein